MKSLMKPRRSIYERLFDPGTPGNGGQNDRRNGSEMNGINPLFLAAYRQQLNIRNGYPRLDERNQK
jgi:hypothetical protein